MSVTRMTRRDFGKLTLGLAALSCVPALCVRSGHTAEAYPTGNINVLIPSRPNGQLEAIARAHSDIWGPMLKTACSFAYNEAASGQVAYTTFSKRPDDGYHLMFGNVEPFAAMYVSQTPEFKSQELYWACTLAVDPAVIVCNKKSPFNSMEDVLGTKRRINVAVAHWSSTDTISAQLTARLGGANFNIIPYGGSNGARLALVQEEADIYYTKLANAMEIASYIRYLGIIQNENTYPELTGGCPTLSSVLKKTMPENQSLRNWVFQRAFVNNYPERCKNLLDAFQEAFHSPEFKLRLQKANIPVELFSTWRDHAWTQQRVERTMAFVEENKDVFKKKR